MGLPASAAPIVLLSLCARRGRSFGSAANPLVMAAKLAVLTNASKTVIPGPRAWS